MYLSSALPSDILQISSLLDSGEEGVIASDNMYSILSSSCLNSKTGLPQKHTWHIIEFSEKEKVFDVRFRQDEVQLKQVNLKFGFSKRVGDKLSIKLLSKEVRNLQRELSSTEAQKLPLVVETNTGSQLN